MFSLDISPRQAINKLADENSKWITLNGVRVHYKDEGKGDAVLMLHNSLMWNGIWDEWIPHAPKELRLIRPDIPGFGLTGPTPNGDYSMQALTQFVADFMDALDITKVSIIGFSLGGQLAWRYALRAPSRVNRMVLINPTGYPEKELPDVFKLAQSWKGNILRFVGSRNLLEKRIRSMCVNKDQPVSYFFDKLLVSQRRKGNRSASIRFMREPSDLQYKNIKNIKVPTQVQWSLYPQEEQFSKDILNSELEKLNTLGHFPCLESPALCSKKAFDFITNKEDACYA